MNLLIMSLLCMMLLESCSGFEGKMDNDENVSSDTTLTITVEKKEHHEDNSYKKFVEAVSKNPHN